MTQAGATLSHAVLHRCRVRVRPSLLLLSQRIGRTGREQHLSRTSLELLVSDDVALLLVVREALRLGLGVDDCAGAGRGE
jgi:hypothetical protein